MNDISDYLDNIIPVVADEDEISRQSKAYNGELRMATPDEAEKYEKFFLSDLNGTKITSGHRHATMLLYARKLWIVGNEPAVIKEKLKIFDEEYCDPPKRDPTEINGIVDWARTLPQGIPVKPPTRKEVLDEAKGMLRTSRVYKEDEAVEKYTMLLAAETLGAKIKTDVKSFPDKRCDPKLTADERDVAIANADTLVDSIIKREDDFRKKLKEESKIKSKKPRLVVSANLDIDGDIIVENLVKWNTPPRLFQQAGKIVGVWKNEHDITTLREVRDTRLRGILATIMDFFEIHTGLDGEEMETQVTPPFDLVQEVGSRHDIPLEGCHGIIRCPIMRGDGTILTTEGYDPTSKLYYSPVKGQVIPEIPENPTKEQVDAALEVLDEIFIDFPFDCQASKDNALAFLLTPVLRPLIDGCIPLCLVNKPQAGVGASWMARAVGHVFCGGEPPLKKYTRDPDENRKAITSMLKAGEAIVVFDNVETTIDDDGLEAVLTARLWSDRQLGTNENLALWNNTVFAATGINLQIGRSMPRRCYPIKLLSTTESPWKDHKKFRHDPLFPWIDQTRGDILAAIFTITRYWIRTGSPKPSEETPAVGGFDEWRNTIGGVLVNAGRTEFLKNVDEMYREYDRETPQIVDFLREIFARNRIFLPSAENELTLQSQTRSSTFTIGELVEKITAPQSELAKVLPDKVSDAWAEGKGLNRVIGYMFSHLQDRVFANGYCIRKNAVLHGQTQWFVERRDPNKPI